MKRVVFSIRPGFPVIYFRDGWVAGDRSGVFSQVVNYKRHRGRAKDPPPPLPSCGDAKGTIAWSKKEIEDS